MSDRKRLEAIEARITGRVQRVGYRRHVSDTAQELGIAGSVKNEDDGSVVVRAQGDPVDMKASTRKLRNPPGPARVKEVDERKAPTRREAKSFRQISRGPDEEMQEGFGAMQSGFSDYRPQFERFAKHTGGDFKELGERSRAPS